MDKYENEYEYAIRNAFDSVCKKVKESLAGYVSNPNHIDSLDELNEESIKSVTKEELKRLADRRFPQTSDEHSEAIGLINSIFFYKVNDHIDSNVDEMYKQLLEMFKK
jgi:hypothetical protein